MKYILPALGYLEISTRWVFWFSRSIGKRLKRKNEKKKNLRYVYGSVRYGCLVSLAKEKKAIHYLHLSDNELP